MEEGLRKQQRSEIPLYGMRTGRDPHLQFRLVFMEPLRITSRFVRYTELRDGTDCKHETKSSRLKSVCFLLAYALSMFCSLNAVKAQSFPYKKFGIQSTQSQKVNALMGIDVEAPEASALDWLICFPCPPELPGQRLTRYGTESGRYSKVQELSKFKRDIFCVRHAVQNKTDATKLSARFYYQLVLTARQLCSAPLQVPMLSAHDRLRYLAESTSFDFNNAVFRNWLRVRKLKKEPSERDIDFAWRLYLTIRRDYHYMYDMNQQRVASYLCSVDKTDCGGLSFLFVSALRANGIPARALIGHWLKPGAGPNSKENDYGKVHVISEFYANGAGWIPVDLSLAVSNKSDNPLSNFGNCDSNFVTMHIDPDLVIDSLWFGEQNVPILQNPVYWVTGRGTTNGANVKMYWQTTPGSN